MVRRTKEEAQETRSQILEAAEKAFFERGVARTTLADIATLAGVTRGAIYWHFSNKADLLQAMLDTLHEPLDELARASENEEELDPLGCIRKLLVRLFQQVALDPKTRRINEILFHKCEFTDEMCDLHQQLANTAQRIKLFFPFTGTGQLIKGLVQGIEHGLELSLIHI